MKLMFWYLLFFTVPIFYIVGLVQVIRLIIGKNSPAVNTDRKELLKAMIDELSLLVKQGGDRSVAEQLSIYQKELAEIERKNQSVTYQTKEEDIIDYHDESDLSNKGISAQHTPQIKHATKAVEAKEIINQDIGQLWERWYANNSINLLLYIGAFLIVASASIFVGFQWGSFSGTVKSLLISLLTISFFIAGIWIYKLPKVKTAGATFCSIGSLLIPLAGIAWYNFVAFPLGMGMGGVWLITSLIGLFSYIGMAFFLRSSLYAYFSTLGTLSMIWSVINIYHLPNQVYILGAIVSAFLLFALYFVVRKQSEEIKELFLTPLNYSSNIMMPAALIFGLFTAMYNNQLFTLEASLAAFLGTVYYLLFYLFTYKPGYLIACVSLWPLTFILAFNWQRINPTYTLYILNLIALSYLIFLKMFQKANLKEEVEINSFASISISILTFFYGLVFNFNAMTMIVLSLVATIIPTTISYIRKKLAFIYLSCTALAALLYYLSSQLFTLSNSGYLLGVTYLIIGLISYYLVLKFESNNEKKQLSLFATSLYILLSLMFCKNYTSYFIVDSFITSLVLFSYAFHFKKYAFILAANGFAILSTVLFIHQYLGENYTYLSGFIMLLASFGFYFLAVKSKKEENENLMIVSLLSTIGFIIISVPFLLSSQLYIILINTYIVVLLFAAAIQFNVPELIYFATFSQFFLIQNISTYFSLPIAYYPLLQMSFALLNYSLYILLKWKGKDRLQYSALAQSIFIPLFYKLTYYSVSPNALEANALISAYIASVLWVYHAYNRRKAPYAYAASVVVLCTYYWQMSYLGFSNVLLYTIPTGLYFLGVAYSRKLFHDSKNEQAFDYIGLAILLLPTLLQSLNSFNYALILGGEGILLIMLGISLKNNRYSNAGIAAIVAAVISQTYSYLFALPRWLITGLTGLLFLIVAIFLLIRRKEDSHA